MPFNFQLIQEHPAFWFADKVCTINNNLYNIQRFLDVRIGRIHEKCLIHVYNKLAWWLEYIMKNLIRNIDVFVVGVDNEDNDMHYVSQEAKC